jgi:RNA recognition motif-containing protein
MLQVVRDKRTNKSKGFGFVSFLDVNDFAKAIKEMSGKYIGNRPCKLRKSSWEERTATHAGGKRKKPEGQQQQAGGPTGPKKKYHIPIAQKFLQQQK